MNVSRFLHYEHYMYNVMSELYFTMQSVQLYVKQPVYFLFIFIS